jgi:hypothetical protein
MTPEQLAEIKALNDRIVNYNDIESDIERFKLCGEFTSKAPKYIALLVTAYEGLGADYEKQYAHLTELLNSGQAKRITALEAKLSVAVEALRLNAGNIHYPSKAGEALAEIGEKE